MQFSDIFNSKTDNRLKQESYKNTENLNLNESGSIIRLDTSARVNHQPNINHTKKSNSISINHNNNVRNINSNNQNDNLNSNNNIINSANNLLRQRQSKHSKSQSICYSTTNNHQIGGGLISNQYMNNYSYRHTNLISSKISKDSNKIPPNIRSHQKNSSFSSNL